MNIYNHRDVILLLNYLHFNNHRILSLANSNRLYHFIDSREKQLMTLNFLTSNEIQKLLSIYSKFDMDKYKAQLYSRNINYSTILDETFPEKLKNICNPPAVIFYKGKLDIIACAVAIVGSRKATEYGKWATKKLVKELSRYDVTIVSGMALGIDRCAHEEALHNKLHTCGVLASSLDIEYPSSNSDLYKAMKGQLLISEFGLATEPLKRNFVSRNRIISALSEAVIVVEAAEKSGSLITANFAIEQGRDVYAVPSSIDSLTSAGCNELIKRGAKLISRGQDIIEDIPYLKELEKTRVDCIIADLSEEEKFILSLLEDSICSIEDLKIKSGYNFPALMQYITRLEMKGYIERIDSIHYTYLY